MHLPDLSILIGSPKAEQIRGQLSKHGHEAFQDEFWQVMRRVQETNDWAELGDFIRTWHRTALLASDPVFSKNLERLRKGPRKRPTKGKTLSQIQAQFTT
jgi:hypothetical protein